MCSGDDIRMRPRQQACHDVDGGRKVVVRHVLGTASTPEILRPFGEVEYARRNVSEHKRQDGRNMDPQESCGEFVKTRKSLEKQAVQGVGGLDKAGSDGVGNDDLGDKSGGDECRKRYQNTRR